MNFTESQLERLWSLAPKMQKLFDTRGKKINTFK